MKRIQVFLVFLIGLFASLAMAQPEYEIISLGQAGESNSGGQAISPDGQFATGFSDGDPFLWENLTGVTPLPSAPNRPFSMPQGVNDAGIVTGIGATTFLDHPRFPLSGKTAGQQFLDCRREKPLAGHMTLTTLA